jgi:hypothetical protein
VRDSGEGHRENQAGYKGNLPAYDMIACALRAGLELRVFLAGVGRNTLSWESLRAGYDSEVTVAVFGR